MKIRLKIEYKVGKKKKQRSALKRQISSVEVKPGNLSL
jgi:hypothetical protein